MVENDEFVEIQIKVPVGSTCDYSRLKNEDSSWLLNYQLHRADNDDGRRSEYGNPGWTSRSESQPSSEAK